MSLLKWMGLQNNDKKSSQQGDWLNQTGNERYFGLENFGNTCYCNSVIQALHNCKPFREAITYYTPSTLLSPEASPIMIKQLATPRTASLTPGTPTRELKTEQDVLQALEQEETILQSTRSLFLQILSQKKKTGTLAPQQFVSKLRKESEQFRSTMHQDAHEFLMFWLNSITETLSHHKKEFEKRRPGEGVIQNLPDASFVHELFEGQLTNETKCLTCETVTSRDEPFMDLSVDIEQHTSITSCLRNFSSSETLCNKNKFFCDKCCSLQEAEKRMKIKKLPNVLVIHLKRFKYQEKLQRYVKLSHRVVFPMELRLLNTSENAEAPDRLYNLFAVIVHIGGGPYHGHYVTLIKSMDQWILFDDDNVEPVEEADLQRYFGDVGTGCGYIFFYQAADFEQSSFVKGKPPLVFDSETTTMGSQASNNSVQNTPIATPTNVGVQQSYFQDMNHTNSTIVTSPVPPSVAIPEPSKKSEKKQDGAFGLNWSLPGFGKSKKKSEQ